MINNIVLKIKFNIYIKLIFKKMYFPKINQPYKYGFNILFF